MLPLLGATACTTPFEKGLRKFSMGNELIPKEKQTLYMRFSMLIPKYIRFDLDMGVTCTQLSH